MNNVNGNTLDAQVSYDPFTLPNAGQAVAPAPFNPYLEENIVSGAAGSYYPGQASYAATAQPVSCSLFHLLYCHVTDNIKLQYHLYAPQGPHREDLLAYHRLAHDFFMPEKLREELQKKSEASLQTMPSKS